MIDEEGRIGLFTNPLQGLIYYGVVTDIPGAGSFSLRNLAGLGANKFFDALGTHPYYAYCLRDVAGAGAAPQGELRAITNYATATGSFAAAFSVALTAGDEILIIHGSIVNAIPGADTLANITMRDVVGNKSDTAAYAAVATASLMRYIKSLLTTAFASGTQLSVITTEHTLSDVNVPGTYTLSVDTVLMAAGDILELRVYQMVLTGGTRRVAEFMAYYGAQPTDDVIKVSIPISNDLTDAGALRFTLLQTFGAAHNYPWKVMRTP